MLRSRPFFYEIDVKLRSFHLKFNIYGKNLCCFFWIKFLILFAYKTNYERNIKIVFNTNSADTDQKQHLVMSDLGVYCIPFSLNGKLGSHGIKAFIIIHTDIAIIQWLTSCYKNRMTTLYITPGYWRHQACKVMMFSIEIMYTFKVITPI